MFKLLMTHGKLWELFAFHSSTLEALSPVEGVEYVVPGTVTYLIEQVKKYPGQVTIYSSGSLSAVARAEETDPEFGKNVKEVVLVGIIDPDNKDFEGSGKVAFLDDSPFLRDYDAFQVILGGSIPLMRVVATLDHVLSGIEVGNAVRDAMVKDSNGLEEPELLGQRPFGALYLHSHQKRLEAGHQQAILLQEPGVAALFYPDIIKGEDDVILSSETVSSWIIFSSTTLYATKLKPEDIDASDRMTLIHHLDEPPFWEKLIGARSRDWNTFTETVRPTGPVEA